jgi:type IV fimbrial biogenesis protein FimT
MGNEGIRRINRPPLNGAGFTLVELLVVMTIAAILLAVGIPNLRSFIISNRLATASNDFFSALNLARSEAIKRSGSVTLARKSSTTKNWSEGWTISAGADTVRESDALGDQLTLYSDAGAADSIAFDAQGRASAAAVFIVCYGGSVTADGEQRARALFVNTSGRVRAAEINATTKKPRNEAGDADISTCQP